MKELIQIYKSLVCLVAESLEVLALIASIFFHEVKKQNNEQRGGTV